MSFILYASGAAPQKHTSPPPLTPTPAPPPPPSEPLQDTPLATEQDKDKDKKAKGIRKKLKQIEEIKTKQKNGTELNSDEVNKLNSEDALVAELKALGLDA